MNHDSSSEKIVQNGQNHNFEFRSLRSLRVFEPAGSTSRLPVNIEIGLLLLPIHFCTDLIKICRDYFNFRNVRTFKISRIQIF